MQIIGAGFGRTGTLSLQAALEKLGYTPCEHMTGLVQDPDRARLWEGVVASHERGEVLGRSEWDRIFSGYGATVDWPGCSFYRELMETYPEAKVILTVRDPNSWYESARDTIYAISQATASPAFGLLGVFAPAARAVGRLTNRLIWRDTFGGRFEDREHAKNVFNQHNEEVRSLVPSDRLLVYEVGEGWEPLCEFLGVPVPPDESFPRLNDREEIAGTARRLRRVVLAAQALALVTILVGLLAGLRTITRSIRD